MCIQCHKRYEWINAFISIYDDNQRKCFEKILRTSFAVVFNWILVSILSFMLAKLFDSDICNVTNSWVHFNGDEPLSTGFVSWQSGTVVTTESRKFLEYQNIFSDTKYCLLLLLKIIKIDLILKFTSQIYCNSEISKYCLLPLLKIIKIDLILKFSKYCWLSSGGIVKLAKVITNVACSRVWI